MKAQRLEHRPGVHLCVCVCPERVSQRSYDVAQAWRMNRNYQGELRRRVYLEGRAELGRQVAGIH